MKPTNRVFTIQCDCCGSKIQVDPDTRSVFSIERSDARKARSFEEVVQDVTSVGSRAEEKFAKTLEKERNREEHLDEVFKKAQQKASQDPRKRPPSIFDYD